MIVSTTVYIIIMCSIAALLFTPLIAGYILKKEFKLAPIWIFCALLAPINWYTPSIITVSDCGVYNKDVTLFPTTVNGIDIKYGKHLYVFNKSTTPIVVQDIAYGNVSDSDRVPLTTIAPENFATVNTVKIDYIFEQPDKSISSKSGGAVKTVLFCKN